MKGTNGMDPRLLVDHKFSHTQNGLPPLLRFAGGCGGNYIANSDGGLTGPRRSEFVVHVKCWSPMVAIRGGSVGRGSVERMTIDKVCQGPLAFVQGVLLELHRGSSTQSFR